MRHIDTDFHWEIHARRDPYWAVITHDRFRQENLTDDEMEEFFESGRDYIRSVHEIIEHHVDPTLKISSALDFGCGVGRLLLPLAKLGYAVTGVDISDTMLDLAHRHLSSAGFTDHLLLKSDDSLSAIEEVYDLVHTFIVMQHIPADRGIGLVSRLLDVVSPNGVCVIHFVYYPIEPAPTLKGRVMYFLGDCILRMPAISAAYEKVKNKRKKVPMLMNVYPLNDVFWEVQKRGFNNVYIRFTDHGKKGLIIFAQRNNSIPHPEHF